MVLEDLAAEVLAAADRLGAGKTVSSYAYVC